MIRHIALFKLAPEAAASQSDNVSRMRERLQALVGVVPGLRSMTVEPEVGLTPGNWDLALISEHDDAAAFEAYQVHPAHRDASVLDDEFIVGRVLVDVELPN